MMLLALLLLTGNQAEIVETTARVKPAYWQPHHLSLRRPGTLDLRYEMTHGGTGVRLVVIEREDEAKFALGHKHTQLAASDFAVSGQVRVHLERAGEYSLIIDNRLESKKAASVKFGGTILYDVAPSDVRTLPWEKRIVVIGASLSVFLSICYLAGRPLWRAIYNRNAY